MSVATPSSDTRSFWSFFWLVLAIFLIPPLVTSGFIFTYPDLGLGWQGLIWFLTFIFILIVWARMNGGGFPRPGRESTLIIRDPTRGGVVVVTKGFYIVFPLIQKIEAKLPTYAFRFEPTIEGIDTNTPMLARISKIRVRLDCKIKSDEHLCFFEKAASRHDLLDALQHERKLTLTDHGLWKHFISGVIHELVDDSIRDVVWNWHDPQTNDPTSLSKNRLKLAIAVEKRLTNELDKWGLELLSFSAPASSTSPAIPSASYPEKLVLELIEVNPEIVKFKMRDFDRLLKKATEEARLEASSIREKGAAEAEVRATTLAMLLHVLINVYEFKHTDALIGEVVRAALYSDGTMIWKNALEKSASGDGKAKTA